jgi:hypothetical protein
MNRYQVLGWAVEEFFTADRFFLDEQTEGELSFVFLHRDTGEGFTFAICEGDTEETLTARVTQAVREFYPRPENETQEESETREEIILTDWKLLLDRYRILDGSEDAFREEDQEEFENAA